MKDYSLEKIRKILALPLGELLYKAQKTHKKYFESKDVQLASLISIESIFFWFWSGVPFTGTRALIGTLSG